MKSMVGGPTPGEGGTRVLIVEDDPAQARLLSRSLARQRPDLTIITSGNGAEAVRLVSETGVDLILTELTTPGLNGFELLAWAANHCPEVPVFAMSTFGDDEILSRVSALGAVGYFAKPIDVKAVILRLTAELSQTVRGHVQNVSLASFLQLLEMERKTCTLAVTWSHHAGTLVIRKGELIHAEADALRGEQAAIAIVAWHNPSITIARHLTTDLRTIHQPLSFIIMEGMRVQDEASHASGVSEWPASRPGLAVSSLPLTHSAAARSSGNCGLQLPSGVRAIAIAEKGSGALLHYATSDDLSISDHVNLMARLLEQQSEAFRFSEPPQEIEEIVLFSSTRWEVIRPLSTPRRFGLVMFESSECNLVVARAELTRFVFACG